MSETTSPLTKHEGAVTVLHLAACSSRWGADQIDKHRAALLEQSCQIKPGQSLLIDMTSVEFFGSAFIELLLQIWNGVKQNEGSKMALCGASNYCMDIITVTRLDSIWPIYPDPSAGVSGLSQA